MGEQQSGATARAASRYTPLRRQDSRINTQQSALVRLLLDVTTAANQARTLAAALPATLGCVREHTGWPIGHAYRIDGNTLRSTELWSMDEPDAFRQLRERTATLSFGEGQGLPGRVLASGRAEAVTDVTGDAGFLRADAANAVRIRAAFAFPVKTGHEIVGVLEFFSRRAIELDAGFLEVMEHVGAQLGRVVDRERARAASVEARKQAEEAAALRDDLLRMVSHDLRNPLNTISLAVSLMHEIELDAKRQAHQLAVIRRAADHMTRLVEDLVDLERLEAGHGVRIERRALEPHRLLDDVMDLVGPQAEAKGIRVIRPPAPQLPPILADPERILQVIWNLVSNALKFTPPDGEIVIRAEQGESAVVFAVADTGPGIDRAHHGKLFEAYWQSRKGGRLGTGLGLPISKGIVESHGGDIWVESEPGQGSTFKFTVPMASAKRN